MSHHYRDAPHRPHPSPLPEAEGAQPRLLFLSGLAADERFLHHQLDAFPGSTVLPWIPWEKRESLAHHAKRLAETVNVSRDRRPLVLAGVSMGGMLALELARHLPVDRVILMSSCRDPVAVSAFLKGIETASRVIPLPLLYPMRLAVLPFGMLDPLRTLQQKKLIADMALRWRMDHMRWAARAILDWPGANPSIPVHHIHGAADWVIPSARLGHPPDALVKGAPHIMPLTHPQEVNAFIKRLVAPICTSEA